MAGPSSQWPDTSLALLRNFSRGLPLSGSQCLIYKQKRTCRLPTSRQPETSWGAAGRGLSSLAPVLPLPSLTPPFRGPSAPWPHCTLLRRALLHPDPQDAPSASP